MVEGDAAGSGDEAGASGAAQPGTANATTASMIATQTMMTLDTGTIGLQRSSARRRHTPDRIPAPDDGGLMCMRAGPPNASTE
jgi:hypothetical protein